MKELGNYKNGNCRVFIYDDGTKIRMSMDEDFKVDFPENIDINITDKCDMECPFCYTNANKHKKHGELLDHKFLDTIKEHTEITINGNDMSHPQLDDFLKVMKDKNVYVGMTLNVEHLIKSFNRVKKLEKDGLLKGIGVSMHCFSDLDHLDKINELKHPVIQVVLGIIEVETIRYLINKNMKILILGYKDVGRGKAFKSRQLQKRFENTKEYLRKEIMDTNKDTSVSFDNLALDQVRVKSILDEPTWNSVYMGDDGEYSMYIDLVSGTYSKSSFSSESYDLKDDVVYMFNTVRSDL